MRAKAKATTIATPITRDGMASEQVASRRAPAFIDPPGYAQHRPETTLLYRLVEQYYPELVAEREAADRPLPN